MAGLGTALNSSVTALKSQSANLASISANISNSDTIGYKSSKTAFKNIVLGGDSTKTLTSGGVLVYQEQNIEGQGDIQVTGISTNLSITGKGFFPVGDTKDSSSSAFTRVGDFMLNNEGYLVNSSGQYLKGFPLDSTTGEPLSSTTSLDNSEAIKANKINSIADASTFLDINANLPSNASAGDEFFIYTGINDSLGNQHNVELKYTKVGTNSWEVNVENAETLIGGTYVSSGTVDKSPITINFLEDGSLDTSTSGNLTIDIKGLSTGGGDLLLPVGFSGNSGNLTQYTSSADTEILVRDITSDGSTYGEFTGIEVSPSGEVNAIFDNGIVKPIYQVQLATFKDPNLLQTNTGGGYLESQNSGGYSLVSPGNESGGYINGSTIEGSNVDIAEEFSNMIIAQQAYSAASGVVKTTSEMFMELKQLK